jgi:hypothetical protein
MRFKKISKRSKNKGARGLVLSLNPAEIRVVQSRFETMDLLAASSMPRNSDPAKARFYRARITSQLTHAITDRILKNDANSVRANRNSARVFVFAMSRDCMKNGCGRSGNYSRGAAIFESELGRHPCAASTLVNGTNSGMPRFHPGTPRSKQNPSNTNGRLRDEPIHQG